MISALKTIFSFSNLKILRPKATKKILQICSRSFLNFHPDTPCILVFLLNKFAYTFQNFSPFFTFCKNFNTFPFARKEMLQSLNRLEDNIAVSRD